MEKRWKDHVSTALRSKGGRWHFPNAVRKYGPEAFSHEVLEVCNDLEVGNLAEECWIELYETRNPEKGFNLAQGGSHTPHPVRNPWDDPSFRSKMTALSKQRAKNPSWRAKISTAHTGVKLSPEHCAAISIARMGKDHTPEVRARINGLIRKTYSDSALRIRHAVQSRDLWRDTTYRKKVSDSVSIALREKWQHESPARPSEIGIHKICKKHGAILKADCYKRIRGSKTYLECRFCYRKRNNAARLSRSNVHK
jgi:hypothetical protein